MAKRPAQHQQAASAVFLMATAVAIMAAALFGATAAAPSHAATDDLKHAPSFSRPGGAFYAKPDNYPSPTSVRHRAPSKHQHPDWVITDPNIAPLAFRPDTFGGNSPFLTFNGRDSSDFLGPGSLGQAVPAGSRKHFVPPTAEFLRPTEQGFNNNNRLDVGQHPGAKPGARTAADDAFDVAGRSTRSLFFGDVDHGAIVLRHQGDRPRLGLPPLRLGSIRPGFAFFRHDY